MKTQLVTSTKKTLKKGKSVNMEGVEEAVAAPFFPVDLLPPTTVCPSHEGRSSEQPLIPPPSQLFSRSPFPCGLLCPGNLEGQQGHDGLHLRGL